MGLKQKQQQVGKVMLWVMCAVFLVFGCWIAFNIPYAHDDWTWGTEVGIEQFLTASLNSRYSGNLLEIILTRSVFLKSLIMGLCSFLLAFLPLCLAGGREMYENRPWVCVACFGFSGTLLFSTPPSIWKQTLGWVAGFSNFVFPLVLVIVLTILIVRLLSVSSYSRNAPVKAVLLFLLTAVLQMFIENLTVFILGAALLLFVIDWRKNSRPSLCFGAVLAGAIIGTVLMFSSGIYGTLLSTGEAVDGYRKLMFETGSGLADMVIPVVQCIVHGLLPFIWGGDQVLGLAILSIMLILLVKNRDCFPKRLYMPLLVLHILTLTIWAVYSSGLLPDYMLAYKVYWDFITPPDSMGSIYQLHYIVEVLYISIVALETIFAFKGDKMKMWLLLVLWASPPLVLLPLAAVNSIGPRSFFTSNYFMIVFAIQIMAAVMPDLSRRWKSVLLVLPLCLLVASCVRLFTVYSAIGSFNKARMDMIEEAKAGERSELIFDYIPYNEYLWAVEPTDELAKDEYKAFFKIPDNVTIIYR